MSRNKKQKTGETISTEEAAEMIGVSIHRIQWLIEIGKVRGTVKEGATFVYENDVRNYGKKMFLRKNRLKVAAITVAAFIIITGLAAFLVRQRDEENVKEYLKIAEKALRDGKAGEADAYLKRVEKISGNDPVTMLRIAKIYVKSNRANAALTYFEKTERISPANKQAVENLCALYFMKGEIETAEEKCRKMLKLSPGHILSMFTLGRIYTRQRRFNEAKTMFENVLKEQPDFYPALEGMAMVYSAMNKHDLAADIYGKGMNGKSLATRLNYAIQKDKSGEHGEAMAVYTEIISNSPVIARAFNNLAWGMVSVEERPSKETLERAFSYARQALLLNPRDAAAADTMGWVLFLAGKDKEAETSLRAAVKSDAGLAVAHFHLARLLLKQKRNAEALQSLETSKKSLKPNDDVSRETLDMFIENARMQKEKMK